jgi:hypothetical protein
MSWRITASICWLSGAVNRRKYRCWLLPGQEAANRFRWSFDLRLLPRIGERLRQGFRFHRIARLDVG